MEFNQPTTVATDPQIEAHLNALRVQIADKEAFITRLDDIITSNQYAIQQLSNEKAELVSQIPDLKSIYAQLDADVKNIASEIQEAKETLKQVESKARYIQTECDLRQVEVTNGEIAVSEDKIAVQATRDELNAKIAETETVKQEYTDKVAKLKEIIN